MPYFPSLKVIIPEALDAALAAPIPQEKEVAMGQSPSCCLAWLCPSPRTHLWGRADFGGHASCSPSHPPCWSGRLEVSCLLFEETSRGTLQGCCGWGSSGQTCPQEPRVFVLLSARLEADQGFSKCFMQTENKSCTCTKSQIAKCGQFLT